ncbi:MAG: AI-2E family transporter [Gammaproteobacteria bacterium]|nr:AI-2E family transporter [Gammaproteobacteria bacterium]
MNAEPGSDEPHVGASADTPVAIVRATVDAQGVALTILSTVALVFALEWAQAFFISLLLGIFLAYTLNRPVMWLERLRVPRPLGASIVMLSVLSMLALGGYALRGQVETIIKTLPASISKFSMGITSTRSSGEQSTLQKMQAATNEIENATNRVTRTVAAKSSSTRVVMEQPSFKFGNFLLAGSVGAAGFIGQATMVLFLVFFLLLSGNTFKRKLVRLTGPSLSKKKITVQMLDEINDSIQRYLFILVTTNALVGLLTWIAFRWIGLENAGAWAAAAGLLHVIPYLGSALTAGAVGMAAYAQFESLSMVLLVSGMSLAIALAVGLLITTWMTGRSAKMNPTAVFIALLFFGWLWGAWGMLLSIPIIVVIKVVSDHVEQLRPVAELLGE